MQKTKTKNLTRCELAAWRGFLRVHAALLRELDRELEETHGLPLTHYEVLLHLASAPEHRLRMTDLAGSVLLSQSGLTRLVDRMQQAGLVVREPCPSDRRVLYARLTAEGLRRFGEARPTHLAGVRARFLDHFDEQELSELGAFWERLRPGVTT